MKKDQDKHNKKENKDKGANDAHAKGGKEPYENKPLPGEYPASEDIMNRKNTTERVSLDPDHLSRNPGAYNNEREKPEENMNEGPFPESKNAKNRKATRKSDLTKEDYEALGPRDLSLDGGDDEQLKHRVWPVDFAAKDLDVPSGEDDRSDAVGQGDEENDHYSLGGDDKENLEEDPTRTFG